MKKQKIKNFIIILIAVLCTYSGNGITFNNSVYAEDDDTSNTQNEEWQQIGDYKYKSLVKYNDQWPGSVDMDIRYEKYSDYPTWPYYVVNLNGSRRRVYQGPSKDSDGIDSLFYGERCKVLELIENEKGEKWYLFVTKIDGQDAIGFIPEDNVELRQFRIEEMYNSVLDLAGISSYGPVFFIDNYRNLNGIPEVLPSGEYYDPFAYRRGQSATGYYDKTMDGEFRYIPDGMLCVAQEVTDITEIENYNIMFNAMGEFVPESSDPNMQIPEESIQTALDEYNKIAEPIAAKVYVPSFNTSLWIDSVFIDVNNPMRGGFGQIVAVDRINQNIGIFEYSNGWKLISMSYATTGKSSSTAVPTPIGAFMALEKKDIFEYQEDDAYVNAGFAPYAIRFSGGGYLHGIPMNYEYTADGARKPIYSYVESILSIGTVPESHMCIRNFTSHAEFVYNWAVIGSCAVVVFE